MSDETEAVSPFEFSDEQDDSLPTDSPLDSGLEPEIHSPTALINAEVEEAEREYRKRLNSDPIPQLTSPERMRAFCNNTRKLPIDRLEDRIMTESMPVMLWKFREFALAGNYNSARAIQLWLDWASKVSSRPKKAGRDKGVVSGALFDASKTKGEVYDAEAKLLTSGKKKAPSGQKTAFGRSGEWIGNFDGRKRGKKDEKV